MTWEVSHRVFAPPISAGTRVSDELDSDDYFTITILFGANTVVLHFNEG
jgi:hypothetical protein